MAQEGFSYSELPIENFGLDEFGFPRQYNPGVPIGSIWVDHGYAVTPSLDTPADCPVCGAPMTTCTNETHRLGMIAQGAPEGSV